MAISADKIKVHCRHVGSQDFVQEGVNLARAQGTPYQKPKTPRIWPTVFWVGPNSQFIFVFLL